MTDQVQAIGLVVIAYLIGAVPASHLVGRVLNDVDLRTHGSGNLGATNVARVLGWGWAVPVAVFDIAKGFAPALVFPRLIESEAFGWTVAFGTAAIAGHMFSFWVGFKGGKGIATTAGVFLAISPLATVLSIAVWAIVVFLTGYVSLGSVLGVAALPVMLALVSRDVGVGPIGFAACVAALALWAHRANLVRLARGTENRFRR